MVGVGERHQKVGIAVPANGEATPLYSPASPSALIVFFVASTIPLYTGFSVLCVCSSTLMVSATGVETSVTVATVLGTQPARRPTSHHTERMAHQADANTRKRATDDIAEEGRGLGRDGRRRRGRAHASVK